MAERIDTWLQGDGRAWQGRLELICEQQLAVEHVFDLAQRQAVLFIDASAAHPMDGAGGTTCDAPHGTAQLTPIEPSVNPTIASHQCPPAVVLGLYQQLRRAPAPPAMLLSATGHDFSLGAPLSAPLQAGMPCAWQLFESWLAHVTTGAQPSAASLNADACAS